MHAGRNSPIIIRSIPLCPRQMTSRRFKEVTRSELGHPVSRRAKARPADTSAQPAELLRKSPLNRLWVGFVHFGADPGFGIATPGAVFFKLRGLPAGLDATRERLSSSLPPYFASGRCAAFFYARSVVTGGDGAPPLQVNRDLRVGNIGRRRSPSGAPSQRALRSAPPRPLATDAAKARP